MNEIQKREDTLFERISALIEEARKRVVTAVNVAEVYTKYGIGQYIVEDEQQGEQRQDDARHHINATGNHAMHFT